ncbi:MAG TPA: T9SS type A sorting domain-containing protein, partial [Phaeodactylibacter sp.]|nr:T9SS type A sorting domain-containing protein [Phaeodactylibacter sp.]
SQVEFAPIGAKWIQNAAADNLASPDFHPLADYYILEATGDSIIANMTFRKVGDYLFLQEGAKIYYWWNDALRLIYDFDLEVGNTAVFEFLGCADEDDLPIEVTFTVEEVSQIMVDQMSLKKIKGTLTTSTGTTYPNYTYIERIGSTLRLLEDKMDCFFIPEYSPDWLRCYTDEDISYQTEQFLSYNEEDCTFKIIDTGIFSFDDGAIDIAPNPTTDLLYISFSGKQKSTRLEIQLLDVHGRVLLRRHFRTNGEAISLLDFPAGVYFVGLKDVDTGAAYMQKLVKL